MSMLGMDITGVRQLANQMSSASNEIQQLSGQLTQLLGNTCGSAPTTTASPAEWHGTYMANSRTWPPLSPRRQRGHPERDAAGDGLQLIGMRDGRGSGGPHDVSAFLGASPQELESLAGVFTRLLSKPWTPGAGRSTRGCIPQVGRGTTPTSSERSGIPSTTRCSPTSWPHWFQRPRLFRYEAHQQDVASGVSSSSASSGGLLGDIERDVSAVAAGIAGMARGVLGSGERALQHVEQVLEGDKKPAKPPATTKPSESAAQIAPAAVAAGAAATVTTIQSIAIGQANAPPRQPWGGIRPIGRFAADYATGNPEWCGAFAAWVLGQKGWANAADSKWGSVASWYTAAQNNQDGFSLVTPPALPHQVISSSTRAPMELPA